MNRVFALLYWVMSWRTAACVAIAIVSVLMAPWASKAAASRVASSIAARAGQLCQLLCPSQTAVETTSGQPVEPVAGEPIDAEETVAPPGTGGADKERGLPQQVSRAKKPKVKGILVRRAAVKSAVKRGVRPSAAYVAASKDHPAGLLVTGWGGAGSALRDGDIITSVGGVSPTSVNQVIGAVAGAYKGRVYELSGRIFRGGQSYQVVVELPYPRDGVIRP